MVCYVATWQVSYSKLAPDLLAKYQAHMVDKARADGESEVAIAAKVVKMEKFPAEHDQRVCEAVVDSSRTVTHS